MTSSSSSAATASAAPGATTPTPAAAATCPRISTRSPSPRTRTGASRSPSRREIHAYLRGLVERFGLAPHIHGGCEVEDARWHEDDGVWQTTTVAGTVRSRFLISADRRPRRPEHPRHPRPRRVSGQGLPLGPLGSRARPQRRARRRRRHRRLSDPVRAPDPARGRRAAPVPAHAAMDHAADQPPDHAASRGRCSGACRRCRGSPAPASTGPASSSPAACSATGSCGAGWTAPPASTSPARSRTRSCARS